MNHVLVSFKKEISLGKIDYNGRGRKNHEVSLKIELRNKEEARDWDTLQEVQNVPELSISGNVWNTRKTDIVSGGQNDDTIREYFGSNPKVRRLIEIWNDYHLNDMKTGTIRQTEAVEKAGIKGREYDYNKAVEHLKEIGLYEDDGYKYGHGWLYQPIPETVIAEVKEIAESFPAFIR